ncbi:hypothetical protein [Spirosoma panaciterrae]|uniref:hypothetical protein n=1 Tax=Spirosoma panaciterrae TaxID=496058 RepID=UPI000382DF74|nr:hypothetical protein [Spirosoma panaciterrae]
MKTFLCLLITIVVSSSNSTQERYKLKPNTTVEGALKEFWSGRIKLAEDQQSSDLQVFWAKHKDEILNNMVVADKYVSSKGDLCLVMYRITVGDKISRKTQWFRKLDDNWAASNLYASSLDDDPLHDGKGELVKKWLAKAEAWEQEDSSEVWW